MAVQRKSVLNFVQYNDLLPSRILDFFVTMASSSSVSLTLTPDFKKDTICKIIEHHFKDDKTKLGVIAQELCVDLVKVFVTEAITRSTQAANAESSEEVGLEHLESILPQLLLDF